MDRQARVVIGAGYGDEGKGLITDYLCHKQDAQVVIRFNGGAQAGHTVITPSGRRHVFSHFGSGSFLDIPTYLSQYFVVNPMLFVREDVKLQKLNVFADVYVDENCGVTTPYDVLINQLLEKKRGKDCHGSVGVGFGETIHRSSTFDRKIFTYGDLYRSELLKMRVECIRHEWFPQRAQSLDLDMDQVTKWLNDDRIFDNFLRDCAWMRQACTVTKIDRIAQFDRIVMEGAQGLLLDQSFGDFPHVTRSNTGLDNAVSICNQTGIRNIEATYVTRSYTTRHGAGPMSGELLGKPFKGVKDDTNLPHDFQGNLRFSFLDVDRLRNAVHRDCDRYPHVRARLAVTCLDQLDEPYGVLVKDGERRQFLTSEFGYIVNSFVGLNGSPLFSYGPSRQYVTEANHAI